MIFFMKAETIDTYIFYDISLGYLYHVQRKRSNVRIYLKNCDTHFDHQPLHLLVIAQSKTQLASVLHFRDARALSIVSQFLFVKFRLEKQSRTLETFRPN